MVSYGMDVEGNPRKKNSRGVIIAILGGAVIIAVGLAIGLAIGLRTRDSDSDSTPDSEQQNGKIPTTSHKPDSESTSDSTKPNGEIPTTSAKSENGRYRFASVVADSKLCSKIGTEVMARHQGNVVDATVATVICNGVLNAHSAGIGGGALFVFYNSTTRTATSFNAREKAPAAATRDMYVANGTQSQTGGKAIGVPGELKGLWELHQRYGSVQWARLIQPTIDLCNNGFPLTGAQHKAAVSKKDDIINDPEFSYLFDDNNEAHPENAIVYRKKLAKTLQAIATEGVDAFYNGSLTDTIVQEIQENGGIITRQDLEDFHVDIEPPMTLNLTENELTVYSMPLPGSGVVLEFMLNILSGYHFSPESVSTVNKSVLTYHRIVEAMKFAYAKRTELGDAKFLNISELISNMTSPEFGEEIRSKIDDVRTHNLSYYGAKFDDDIKPGTAHFSLMDGEGNAVAVTSTVNLYFGSKVKGNKTGIIFNDEMDDFSTPNTTNFFGVPASSANFIEPGKRPLSSMSPTVVVNSESGEVELVVGAAGGTLITTAVAMVAIKTLWFNETVTKAVDDPRVHHQLLPPQLFLGQGFPADIRQGLEAKGHQIVEREASVVTAIRRTPDNMLEGVSDFRKGGAPDGF
ncbi:glutathione hydrolase 1 proenzyme-like [Littorina saxatilis]|uniref:glutathione hydrolase 1 proenzyme-like n=1 Tax=Littorina saxatilis TaxID=31220 RepID=UPI0038B56172